MFKMKESLFYISLCKINALDSEKIVSKANACMSHTYYKEHNMKCR